MKTQQHWYHNLWLWSVIYFSLGFVNILFALLGLISFCLPLLFAIFGGNKLFCNRYCDRGQLLRFFGSQLGFSRRHDIPQWMHSNGFRFGFMIFFFAMFGGILYTSWMVYLETTSLKEVITLFWCIEFPRSGAATTLVSPAVAQFAFGLYSLMLTSEFIALAAMFYYRPRTWCAFCPMGTLTQSICKRKLPTQR